MEPRFLFKHSLQRLKLEIKKPANDNDVDVET